VSCDGRGCGRGFGLRGWRVWLVMYVWLGVAECDWWLGVWLVAGGWWLVAGGCGCGSGRLCVVGILGRPKVILGRPNLPLKTLVYC
jgi:hypothetical protein